MKTLISAQQLSKRYGSRNVVKNIHLEIRQGEILGLIGPNGAGKSTTVEMLVGLRRQDSGKIQYWCTDYKRRLGVQLQMTPFFPGLNALENLKLFAAFYKKGLSSDEGKEILQLCGLSDVARTDAARLSGGQQKRLSIAISMIHQPDLLFLDEPTASLDPRARIEIHQLIKSLAQQGVTVVFSSHDMDEVTKLCDRIAMINQGQIVVEGHPDEICSAYNAHTLENVYLHLTNKEGVMSC